RPQPCCWLIAATSSALEVVNGLLLVARKSCWDPDVYPNPAVSHSLLEVGVLHLFGDSKQQRLFEHQKCQRIFGCQLIMTTNHLLTLREYLRAPFRRSRSDSVLAKGVRQPDYAAMLTCHVPASTWTLDRPPVLAQN
ncbi:hypothetical protein pipiens_009978, partial [Culex pipiens pipiens]